MVTSEQEWGWLASLERPDAYPTTGGAASRPQAIQRINTHISNVFLTDDRAYKLRRPVTLPFLDFSDPQERLADCIREVRLNRRLAADVYIGIAPILLLEDGRAQIGDVGEQPSDDPRAVEHCVVMRRLEAGRDLRSMLERNEVRPEHLDRVAERLATFHAEHSLGTPAPFQPADWIERTTAPARANFDALAAAPAELVPSDKVEQARKLAAAFVQSHREQFDERLRRGRVVDAHGDLHAEHVWFEHDDSEPLMIDCLEFREDFRCIDAASDVAFLAMDLTYRGRKDLATRFLRRYARASGDYHLFSVVDYFVSYRALVRAKVASLVATDESMPAHQRSGAAQSVKRHFDLGLAVLQMPDRGDLVLTCGSIGTGKSTVAEALADAAHGVVISSDRLRCESSPSGEEPSSADGYGRSGYSDAARAAVYEQLLAEARHVIRSGRTAILDATYSRRSWRDAAAAWGKANAGKVFLVEVVAPREDVLQRLARRKQAGTDASEAGPELYDAMLSQFEPPVEWPPERRASINTSDPEWKRSVCEAVASLRSGGGQ